MVIDSILLTSSDTVRHSRTRQHDDAQSRVRFQAFLGKCVRQNIGSSTAKILTSSHVQILPSPLPTCTLSLSPSPSSTSQSDPLSHNPPTSMQASKRARKQALSTKKNHPQPLSLHLRFATPRIKKASCIIRQRLNNQNQVQQPESPKERICLKDQGGGGEEKEKKYFKDAGYRTAWTDMYIYIHSTKMIPFYRLFLLFFFFFFFLLSLCATMAKKMLLEHYRCAGVIFLGGV